MPATKMNGQKKLKLSIRKLEISKNKMDNWSKRNL